MKCVICNRTMAAAAVWIGGRPIGPTCARRRGLVPQGTKRAPRILIARVPVQSDTLTRDLFEVANG